MVGSHKLRPVWTDCLGSSTGEWQRECDRVEGQRECDRVEWQRECDRGEWQRECDRVEWQRECDRGEFGFNRNRNKWESQSGELWLYSSFLVE